MGLVRIFFLILFCLPAMANYGSWSVSLDDRSWVHQRFLDGATELSYEWLVELIKSTGSNSIEEVLPHLPENLRANFTLMKESQSLQSASPLFPRAIVFAHDASLILTFNGHRHQTRHESLEVFEYSDVDQKARLYEIDFSKEGSARFSGENPSACLKCHASYPKPRGAVKPIWASYSDWVGAYGERDDELIEVHSRRGGEYEGISEEPLTNEFRAEQFAEFSVKLGPDSTHPRYRHLLPRTEFSPAAPYVLKRAETFADGGFHLPQRVIVNMPNLRLAKILSTRNAQRVARQLIDHPRFVSAKYNLLYQGLCREFPGAQGDGDPVSYTLTDFDLWLNDLNIGFNEHQFSYNNGNPQLKSEAVILHEIFRRVMAEDEHLQSFYRPTSPLPYYQSFGIDARLGRSLRGLEFRQLPDSLQFSYAWAGVLEAFGRTYHPLSASGEYAEAGQAAELCLYLRDRSVKKGSPFQGGEWQGFFSLSAQAEQDWEGFRSPETILQNCADCHDGPSGESSVFTAPYFPFGSVEGLQEHLQALQEYGDAEYFIERIRWRTQPDMDAEYAPESLLLSSKHRYLQVMPLGRKRLSREEQEGLLLYLQNLLE